MEPSSRSLVRLDGSSLTLAQVVDLADDRARAELAPGCREAMAASRAVVDGRAGGATAVYGVNTGFGHLATVRIEKDRLEQLQRNLVRSHCAGVGPLLDRRQVRAAMALRANALARGHSGIRCQVVETLLALLNGGVHPLVPSRGSVGASGDLAPLAQLALALMGEGQVERGGHRLPAALALQEIGVRPVTLKAKEGLALINGTQVSTGVGILAQSAAADLVTGADLAGATSLEALKGTSRAFDPRVAAVRPHPGPARSSDNLRRLLAGSAIAASHRDCDRVQDSYALRCMPQVHGAVRDALSWIADVLVREANSSTDNPLVFAAEDEMISCGNFHGAPVGHALDLLAIVVTDLAAMSERRLERLVNPSLSGLPAFLTSDPGLSSGLMMAQVTAAALVSECRTLAHPASVDTIPTSADKEDHVSMATWAARKANQVVERARSVLAIEVLAAVQALDFLEPLAPGEGVAALHAAVRQRIPRLKEDRPLSPLITEMEAMLADGSLRAAAAAAVGPLH